MHTPILIGVLSGLVAVCDYVGVVSFPIGAFGVSAFYVGAAFYSAFAIWFGWPAIVSIYMGLIIAAFMTGRFTIFTPLLALGNPIGALLPMLAFRLTRFDVGLRDFRSASLFLLTAALGQSLVSAAWTLTGAYLFGLIPKEALRLAVTGWLLGGVAVETVIGLPLMRGLSSVVARMFPTRAR